MKNKISKRSQAWGLDLMIALIIFSLGLISFFIYSINYTRDSEEIFEKMTTDANYIADSLLSSGYPSDWNSGNVVSIGIVDRSKINQTKLEQFYDICLNDYDRSKLILNTRYDYLFFLDDNFSINSESIRALGKPGITPGNVESENLIRVTRLVYYNNRAQNAYVYVWED